MSIQDANGSYYTANQGTDGSWSVGSAASRQFIRTLPDGWADTKVEWQRDMSYLGVFRSESSGGYKFANDGRAIIQYIRNTQGIQGYGLLTIWVWNKATFDYDVFYPCELDMKTYADNWQNELLSVGTLDNGLVREIHAYGDTKYNIPFWTTPDNGASWETDAEFLIHPGIKLLYNATFASSASETNPLVYAGPTNILGFHHGNLGDTAHTIPCLVEFNITQNNGTTTYIGNDILQPFLIQGSQNSGAAHIQNEVDFSGTNNSQPYTRSNFSLKNAIPAATTGIEMWASVSGSFLDGSVISSGGTSPDPFIGFVLFEIGPGDQPVISGGQMQYTPILKYLLPAGPGTSTPPQTSFAAVVPVTINPDRVYVFGIIYDGITGDGLGLDDGLGFSLSGLQFSIYSKYNTWPSASAAVPAPSLNPSPACFFRPYQMLGKLVANLATITSDDYGFPRPVATPYSAHSDYLSNAYLDPVGDIVPYQVALTSAYSLHDLAGRSYITLSLNELFDFCKKQLGCGMGIEGNVLRVEQLSYFFDANTMLLDLGSDIDDFEESQLTYGLGANLKLGYTKADTNSDFGVDPFITELYFDTPLSNIPEILDYEETGILCEQYAIEKIRAQQTSQPIGEAFDPANPSTDNQCVALYLPFGRSSASAPFYDPIGNTVYSPYFTVEQFADAQSRDPNASTALYIYGMYYPDTAINIRLSPCRALQRGTGQWLHSVLDLMDDQYLVFRNTGVMQFDNTVALLAGIESNLNPGGSVVTEFKDIKIGDLPPKLFRPIVYKFTSKYPVNMYQLLNTNANGYVQFAVQNKAGAVMVKKGFIVKAAQVPGTQAATQFELWATPDM